MSSRERKGVKPTKLNDLEGLQRMEEYYVIVWGSERCFTGELTSCTVTYHANTRADLSKAVGTTLLWWKRW